MENAVLNTPPQPCRLRVVLASNSPRRRELLALICPDFEIAPSRDIDEAYDHSLPTDKVAEFLSKIKSEAYADLASDGNVIITADTVVICDDKILGKPHDAEQARQMLRSLSGRTHKVVTGVTLRTAKGSYSFSETTYVHFDRLDDTIIDQYIERFKPFDKAGAYGIQEWIGAMGISGIEGCYYNVMGLPLHSLYKALTTFGAPI